VEELFNDFIVENPATGSAVELTKVQGTGGNPSRLSARVIFSGLESNIARFDSNGIYVDGTQISANTASIQELWEEVDALKSGGTGCCDEIEEIEQKLIFQEGRIDAIEETTAETDSRLDAIDGELSGLTELALETASGLTDEVIRATEAEEALQEQIELNEVKALNDSVTVEKSETDNCTYIKVNVIDAGDY
jgi:uncharacterized coiled-coil protein SlyX